MKNLDAIVVDYIKVRAPHLAPRTVELYTSLLRFIPPFPVTPRAIDEIQGNPFLLEHERTAQLVDKLICAACRRAYRYGELDSMPWMHTDRVHHQQQRRRCWTAQQAIVFLQSERGSPYYATWLLAICCGLRRGELLGVRWSDIEGRMLRVRNQRYRLDGLIVDAPPKTRTSCRSIPLPEAVMDALRARRRADMGRRYVCPCDGPEELRRAFRAACGRAGVEPIALHGLRHTFATIATNRAGIPAKQLQSVLGHASIGLTMDTYTHDDTAATWAGINSLCEWLTRPENGAFAPDS